MIVRYYSVDEIIEIVSELITSINDNVKAISGMLITNGLGSLF